MSTSSSSSSSALPSVPLSVPSASPKYSPEYEAAARSLDIEKKLTQITLNDSDHDEDAAFDEQSALIQQQRDAFKAAQRASAAKASPSSPSSEAPSGQFLVLLYSGLLLLTSVGNSIYFKKMLNHMENHVYFLNQFTSFIFVPVFAALVAYQFKFTNDITKEMQEFPKIKFFIMGIFDALCGVLTMFGAVHTAGSTQALLSNSVIPITMFMSYFILKQRFRSLQYAGASVIMAGILFVLWPQLMSSLSPSTDLSAPADDGGNVDADVPFFNFLFILSVVPGALSSIYKELAFNDADIDANYLQYWVALWQFVFGFVLAPLNTFSFLGSQTVPWNELFSAITDGTWCLMGYNTRVAPACLEPGKLCDDCEGAWVPLLIYLVFNLAFNMFSVLLIKHGSATLMFIIMTLRLPLVQIAFSMRFINDPPDTFAWTSGAGLAVIIAGLVLYRWPAKEADGAKAAADRVIMPGMLDNRSVFMALYTDPHVHLTRSAHQIRSALYSSLGVIGSPSTPYSHSSRKAMAISRSNGNGQSSRASKSAANGAKANYATFQQTESV